MKTGFVSVAILFLALVGFSVGFSAGAALAQAPPEISTLMSSGFEQLQQGNLAQAQGIFEEILRRDPGNPLALNNLATIMIKKGKDAQALKYLKEALPRAKAEKVTYNRVCSLEGVCAVNRLSNDSFGTENLAALIEFNIRVVEGNATRRIPSPR